MHDRGLDPEGPLWSVVLASTGQPRDMHGSVRAPGAPSAGLAHDP
jgi:hypothetical protein